MATFIQQGILHFCLIFEDSQFHPNRHSESEFRMATFIQQTPYVLQVHMAIFNQQCISISWKHQNFKMPQLKLVNFPSLAQSGLKMHLIWPLPSTDPHSLCCWLYYPDIDECLSSDNSGCEQSCINVLGTYECSCQQGYTLEIDGRNCSGKLVSGWLAVYTYQIAWCKYIWPAKCVTIYLHLFRYWRMSERLEWLWTQLYQYYRIFWVFMFN